MKIIQIKYEHFEQLLKDRVSLDSIFVLEQIAAGEEIPAGNVRIDGIIQTLQRKGFISKRNTITEAGASLLHQLSGETPVKKMKVPKVAMDINGLVGLHKKLQDKLTALTGKPQMRPDIRGKAYSFLCNETDLINRLGKVISMYKLTDFQKIENTLLNYIEGCNKSRNWFPIIQYYILKKGNDGIETSQMVTDMQLSPDGEKTQGRSEFRQIDI